nr:DUF58 domain-containing protein [Rhodospirillales bacterium]
MTRVLRQLYQQFNKIRGRRIFIVPTRFGFVYAGFLFLILLGAVNYSNSLGHVLSFLLGSLGLVAMLHSYRNLAKIELKHAGTQPVFCGQEINFTLVFDNPTIHDSYQIEISSKQEKTHSWNPFRKIQGYKYPQLKTHLPSQQTSRLTYSLPSRPRGNHSLGHIRIASVFPLGLYFTWSYFNNNYTVLVYPKPEGKRLLPQAKQQGNNVNQQQQKGLDDFSGFNRYRLGDPIHAIAWKSLAKDNVLRTKQFISPLGGNLMLTWQDVSQIKTIEARLSQLCQWILHAESAGMSYGLTLPKTTIMYGHGEVHCHHCLSALALYE